MSDLNNEVQKIRSSFKASMQNDLYGKLESVDLTNETVLQTKYKVSFDQLWSFSGSTLFTDGDACMSLNLPLPNMTSIISVVFTTEKNPEAFLVIFTSLFDPKHEVGLSDSSSFEYIAPKLEISRLLRMNVIDRINSKHFKCDRANQHMIYECTYEENHM